MGKTSILRDFVKYSSLNVLGMIGLSCYILADTFFVAKGLGANGLTALNLAIPIYSFIHGSSLMFGMGGATKYSIFQSQKDEENANRVFTNTLILTALLSIVFFIVGMFFSTTITRVLGADDAVFAMTKTYLRVILLFAPMFMLNNVLLCFVRNDGAPHLSMLAMLVGSLSNIVLDYVFIFPFRMGIFGAVLATGCAPIISMLILSSFFIQKKNRFKIKKGKMVAKLSRGIISCGLPSLITEVSAGIVMIVFNTIILGLQGNIGVAAYGVIANLSLVVISIYTGIAQGIQPLVSQNYGAGNMNNVRSILRYSLISALAVSGLIYTFIFLGADQIASVFNSEGNALLQSIAVVGLKVYFTAILFAGFNIIVSVYFTSTEYTGPAHVISILRGFVVIIPMTILLAKVGGMAGVWLAFPLTELIVSGIGVSLLTLVKRPFQQSNYAAIMEKLG